MSLNEAVTAELKALEERLLDPDVRRSAVAIDALLGDEFFEIGSSGRTYTKAEIIDLLSRRPVFDGPRSVTTFSARSLAPDVVLVTYEVPESATLRSSIWRFDGRRWRLVFHHGTPRY